MINWGFQHPDFKGAVLATAPFRWGLRSPAFSLARKPGFRKPRFYRRGFRNPAFFSGAVANTVTPRRLTRSDYMRVARKSEDYQSTGKVPATINEALGREPRTISARRIRASEAPILLAGPQKPRQ